MHLGHPTALIWLFPSRSEDALRSVPPGSGARTAPEAPGGNERLIPRRGTRFPRLPCPCPGHAQSPRQVLAGCSLSPPFLGPGYIPRSCQNGGTCGGERSMSPVQTLSLLRCGCQGCPLPVCCCPEPGTGVNRALPEDERLPSRCIYSKGTRTPKPRAGRTFRARMPFAGARRG